MDVCRKKDSILIDPVMGRQAFQDLLFSGVANKSWYDSIDIVASSDTLEDH